MYVPGHRLCFHQTVRSVGICQIYSKTDTDNQFQSFCYKNTWYSILSVFSPADDHIIFLSSFPERFKFFRQCLAVWICLENVICTIFECILIAIKHSCTMTAVWFCYRNQQRACLCTLFQFFICRIFAPVINDNQTWLTVSVMLLYNSCLLYTSPSPRDTR